VFVVGKLVVSFGITLMFVGVVLVVVGDALIMLWGCGGSCFRRLWLLLGSL